MATLPTLHDAERAILEVFKQRGTRPSERIRQIALNPLMEKHQEKPQFRAEDLNSALESMQEKGWIVLEERGLFIKLLEAGFKEV